MAHDGRLSMIAARIGCGPRQLPWLVSLVCVYSAWSRLSTTCNDAISSRAKRYGGQGDSCSGTHRPLWNVNASTRGFDICPGAGNAKNGERVSKTLRAEICSAFRIGVNMSARGFSDISLSPSSSVGNVKGGERIRLSPL